MSHRHRTKATTVDPRSSEAMALLLIADEGPQRRREIKEWVGFRSDGAATALCTRLAGKGLIARTGYLWHLTLAGMAEAERIDPQEVAA